MNLLTIKKNVFTLLLIMGYKYSSCQSLDNQAFVKVVYAMDYRMDSLNLAGKKSENMELLYNDAISVFQSVGKGLKDSLNYEGRKNNATYDVRDEAIYSTIPRTMQHYAINRIDDKIWVLDTYKYGGLRSDGYQKYVEEVDLNWNITEKTDTINGFLVQQAFVEFGGRRWEAWFAPDLPIPIGPYKFYGLPGLIVNIKDSSGTWAFMMKTIETEVQRSIIPVSILTTDVKQTEKLKFFSDRNYYFENRTLVDESTGEIIVLSSEARRNAIAQDKIYAKSNNNWIELYP